VIFESLHPPKAVCQPDGAAQIAAHAKLNHEQGFGHLSWDIKDTFNSASLRATSEAVRTHMPSVLPFVIARYIRNSVLANGSIAAALLLTRFTLYGGLLFQMALHELLGIEEVTDSCHRCAIQPAGTRHARVCWGRDMRGNAVSAHKGVVCASSHSAWGDSTERD
jgi:hypothetical protein